MDNAKVNEVLRGIADKLQRDGYPPHRLEKDLPQGPFGVRPCREAMSHCHALALAGIDLPAEKLEKKMRWLGWIQGVLWAFGAQSIEEQKRANMPNVEK
jgi:hypothetical protein